MRKLHLESLESRILLDADIVISELMASNGSSLLDYDDDNSDWLEIHNRDSLSVHLKDWYLTDDVSDLTKWPFPDSTVLAADDRLVVFASNKDYVAANGELHTNFKLDSAGEFLALVNPAGDIAFQFNPFFPSQTRDIAYGIEENIPLMDSLGVNARVLVPSNGNLEASWTGGEEPFDDLSWTGGTTAVGYEAGGLSAQPIAYWTFDELSHTGTIASDARGNYDATVSGSILTTGGLGRFGEALSFDGEDDYVSPGVVTELVSPSEFSLSLWFRRTIDHVGDTTATNHSVNNVLIAQTSANSNDNLEIGTENDLLEVYLDTTELGGNIPPIRESATIQNDIWHHLVMTYDSNDPWELKLYLDAVLVNKYEDWGGPVQDSGSSPFTIGLSRPTGAAWGGFEGLIDDLSIWDVALDEQHVSALFNSTTPLQLNGYTNWLGLDLANELHGQNSSAYIRVPFHITDPTRFNSLTLKMHFDDAFIAYLNGTEAERSNVSETPRWNSTADTDRPDKEALIPVEFPISQHLSLLKPGLNLLAIHAMNANSDATRLLIAPQLTATPHLDSAKWYTNSRCSQWNFLFGRHGATRLLNREWHIY